MTAAKDLADASIDISLWYLHPSSVIGQKPFDPSLFYIPLLIESAPTQTETADDGAFDDTEDDVMNRVEAAGEEGFDLIMVGIRRSAPSCAVYSTNVGGAGSTTSDSHSSYASSSRLEKHIAVGIYKTIQIIKKNLITSSLLHILSHHHLCFTSYHIIISASHLTNILSHHKHSFPSYHIISVIAFTAQYQKHFSLLCTSNKCDIYSLFKPVVFHLLHIRATGMVVQHNWGSKLCAFIEPSLIIV